MKIWAIGKSAPGITMKMIMEKRDLLEQEMKHEWELYVKGIIREHYFRMDQQGGAHLVLECANIEEAQEVINGLPLIKEKLVEFELIPLGAFMPLQALFKDTE